MSVCPACKLSHTNMQKQPSAGVVTNFSSCFDNWVRSKSNLAPVMFRKLLQNHREAVEQQLLENKKKYLGDKFTEEDAKPAKPYSVMVKSGPEGIETPIVKKPYVTYYNTAQDQDHWRSVV